MSLPVRLDRSRKLEMRIYGSLCVLLGLAGPVAIHQEAPPPDGNYTRILLLWLGPLVALGICLLCVQIWAEIIFISGLTIIGIGLALGAVVEAFRDTPWVLLNLPFVPIWLIPLMLNWKRLRSGTFFAYGG
jgi:hypothetical protein